MRAGRFFHAFVNINVKITKYICFFTFLTIISLLFNKQKLLPLLFTKLLFHRFVFSLGFGHVM